MKKLISKIKNKRLKGNVSLLVILILLASSVISLLSINQIQRLLTYGNMTFNYFRAFYLAKAWTELWLTEVYNSGDGFTHSISGDNIIIQNNLVWMYTGFDPYFKMTITWSFATLTNDIRNPECNWNKIELTPWAGIMLSLFFDNNSTLPNILSDNVGYKRFDYVNNLSLNWTIDSELTFAFFTYKYDSEVKDYVMDDIVVETWNSLTSFLINNPLVPNLVASENRRYLTIKNSWNKSVEFCITTNSDKVIPYSDSIITVFWHYGDMEVGLQSIVKKWVPDWTLNVIGQQPSS